MKLLALDVGSKRIGLAMSDELGFTAQPIEALQRSGLKADLAKIKEKIETFQIGEIVVGYPIHLDGSVGTQAESVLEFVEELKKEISIPVALWDERLSTVAVERLMLEGDLSRKKRKKRVDSLSAQWILQGYLENKRSKKNNT